MSWIEGTLLVDASWLALATWLGLLATIAGFWFTLVQVFKARRASEAARLAVEAANERFRRREQLVDAKDGHAHLDKAQTFVQERNFRGAEFCLVQVLRILSILRPQYSGDIEKDKQLEKCIGTIESCLQSLASENVMSLAAFVIRFQRVDSALSRIIGESKIEDK